MEVKHIYVNQMHRYDSEAKKSVMYYTVSVTLENDKETRVDISLNDSEQKKLLNTLADILPAKLSEFGREFQESLRSDDDVAED